MNFDYKPAFTAGLYTAGLLSCKVLMIYCSHMEESEHDQRERLIKVLGDLEDLTKRQVSLKFIFVRGIIYGLGTVIGATVLISILSYSVVQIFGVEVIDTNAVENLQNQIGR